MEQKLFVRTSIQKIVFTAFNLRGTVSEMSNPNVKFNPNPNFKEDVMKAAQEKLSSAVAPAKAVLLTEKETLQALQRGETFGNHILENLWRKGLIEVQDVSTLDTPEGQRDLLFTFITEKGKKVLES